MHRTYRWLDAPPRLFGFSFRQWVLLVLAVGGGYGVARGLHLPFKVAVSVGAFAIGLPAALAYLSEGDGLPVGRLVLDGVLWCWARGLLWCGGFWGRGVCVGPGLAHGCDGADGRREAAAFLGLVAIGEDGIAVRDDGVYLRYLEVEPVNPLVCGEAALEQLSAAFGGVLGRLEGGRGCSCMCRRGRFPSMSWWPPKRNRSPLQPLRPKGMGTVASARRCACLAGRSRIPCVLIASRLPRCPCAI